MSDSTILTTPTHMGVTSGITEPLFFPPPPPVPPLLLLVDREGEEAEWMACAMALLIVCDQACISNEPSACRSNTRMGDVTFKAKLRSVSFSSAGYTRAKIRHGKRKYAINHITLVWSTLLFVCTYLDITEVQAERNGNFHLRRLQTRTHT